MLLANPPALFSSEFWTALPSTIAAVGSIIATILAYRKSTRQRHAARIETNLQFQDQNEKLDEIQQTTNGTLDAAMKRINDLENLIKELRKNKGG
jgi:hypothetical protein